LTAVTGGERDLWEQSLFGAAYATASVSERPTYGALHVVGHADGPSPRFGSCYLLLRPEVCARATYSWGDSYRQPRHVGTLDAFDAILVAWFERVNELGQALGCDDDLASLLAVLMDPSWSMPVPEKGTQGRVLDEYVEAQVHGDVLFERDVESVVVDPSFDGTETGERLATLAESCGFALHRHLGFLMDVAHVPSDFRGPRMPALARRIASAFGSMPDTFDAAAIGRAAAELHHQPWRWADWDGEAETLQHLKQLWHVLVRFGDPACSRG
jgi:hypothetical protein